MLKQGIEPLIKFNPYSLTIQPFNLLVRVLQVARHARFRDMAQEGNKDPLLGDNDHELPLVPDR